MISKLPGLSYSCRGRYVAFVEKREFVSLMGNQRVGIFPPKSKNSLPPENIFHLISKNPGLTFSARRSHVVKICRMLTCTSERRIGKKNKEIRVQGYVLPVEYLRNGGRYSRSVFTFINRKSHATNWFKRCLCGCHRSSYIIVVNIKNFPISLKIRSSRINKSFRTKVRERLNKEISRSGLCASGRISPKRYEIFEFRFHYYLGQESRYQRGTNVVFVVFIVSEI